MYMFARIVQFERRGEQWRLGSRGAMRGRGEGAVIVANMWHATCHGVSR